MDKTPEQIAEARDWASDCVGMVGTKMDADRAIRYVTANYPGGWGAFVAECCTDAWACATKSCGSAATQAITYPGLDGQTVCEHVCQPCASAYLSADPHVSLAHEGGR